MNKKEEIFKNNIPSFPEKSLILKAMEEYGKQQYNQAIDDAAESADCIHYFNSAHGCEYSVDKDSILKLKKGESNNN